MLPTLSGAQIVATPGTRPTFHAQDTATTPCDIDDLTIGSRDTVRGCEAETMLAASRRRA